MQALSRPLTEVHTDASAAGTKLGSTYVDEKGNEYIFLDGVASTIAGSWVTYNPDDFSTALLTKANADKLLPMAVAMAAIVADKKGWYQIKGKVDAAAVLASCAAEVAIYTSGTAGYADDDSTSQTKINRALLTTARGGTNGTTVAHIMYPSAA